MRCRLATFALLALLLTPLFAPSASVAGSLTGTNAAITATQNVNLTTQGTADWAHWGLNGTSGSTPGEFDHKVASGTTPVGLISSLTAIGTNPIVSYPTTFVNCSWTGGTPTASATTSSEVDVKGDGNGLRFTVPADTATRTLTVYVGGFNDYATLTAHLSDGSAADFTDSSYGYNKPGNSDGAHYQAVYTLTYSAASAGQTLTVSWAQTSSLTTSGNATLQAATLAVVPPLAPTGVVATAVSSSQISLTWTASAGATSYNVKRSTVSGGPYTVVGSPTTASFLDTGLTPATRYYYVVTAVNAGGESAASSEVPKTTYCTAPTNLTATGGTNQIGLTWTASTGATSYSLYRGTAAGGEGTTAYKSGLTGTSYTDTAVTVGTSYYYTLKAVNAVGASASSNEAHATATSANFSLSTYPSRLTLTQGLSSTLTLSVLPTGGFNGNVTLTNSALPTGVTLTYGTNPATSTSVLTFTATTSAVLGQTSVTLTGTSGSLIKTVVIPLTVAPQVSGADTNIALASSVGEVSFTTGSLTGGSTLLTITPVNGYIGPVSFAATGLPSGVSVVTSPTTVSIAGTSAQTTTATFKATSTVTPGYYAVGITGSGSDGATDTAVLGLNILPPTNSLPFKLTVTDSATNAIPNGIASAVVTLTTTNGYSKPIGLSLIDDPSAPVLGPANTTDPTKIGVSFSQTSLSVSGTSALTLTVGASVAPGAYQFQVSGLSTDGSMQRTAFTLFVAPEGGGIDPNIDGSRPSQTYTGDNPTYPLAASTGDMQRFDFDPGSVFEVGSGGHTPMGAIPPPILQPNAPLGNTGLPDATDDRKYVAATIPPPYTYPYRACVRIKAFWTSTSFACGSGTLIGKNHILTAAHVIFDPTMGGMAKTIYIMPGYDYTWSQSHSLTYTTANHAFVAKGYLNGAKFGYKNSYDYDDWAIIDCNPITNGPQGQRGRPLGSYTQYMQLDNTDNVPLPDTNTHIAGYPGFTWSPATPVLTGSIPGICPDLFETYVYNGDDGAVDASPEASLISESPDLLFSTMDISHGDSGAGLWFFSDDDNDYHVYGVVDAIVPWSDQFGFGSGWTGVHAQITGARYSIIKTQEKSDGDEPPDVYTP